MNVTLQRETIRWKLGLAWVFIGTAGFFIGVLIGALLNSFLWPSIEVPSEVDILAIIDNPIQRMLVIGASLGCTMSVAEWIVLRQTRIGVKGWILATIIGWTLGYGVIESASSFIYNRSIAGAIGGATIGIIQWFLLRRNVATSFWWIVAHAIGGLVALHWVPPNLQLFMIYQWPLSFGLPGLITSMITGATLIWLIYSDTRVESSATGAA